MTVDTASLKNVIQYESKGQLTSYTGCQINAVILMLPFQQQWTAKSYIMASVYGMIGHFQINPGQFLAFYQGTV